jgi:hypothetical protein
VKDNGYGERKKIKREKMKSEGKEEKNPMLML